MLLVCFNEPLAGRLKAETADQPNIKATTFHGLCFELGRAAGISVPAFPRLRLVASRCCGHALAGRSIRARPLTLSWWMRPRISTRTGSPLSNASSGDPEQGFGYLFTDRQQALYQTGWNPPDGFVPFELDINCRSTHFPIVKRISRVYGEELGFLAQVVLSHTSFSEPTEAEWLDRVQDVVARTHRRIERNADSIRWWSSARVSNTFDSSGSDMPEIVLWSNREAGAL